jgi:hypothetical protein
MVPPHLEQVPRGQTDRPRAQAAPLVLRSDEEVDAGMAVFGCVFLGDLEAAGHHAVHLDHERDLVRLVQVSDGLVRSGAPPARHTRLREDRAERRAVYLVDRSKGYPFAGESRDGHRQMIADREPDARPRRSDDSSPPLRHGMPLISSER